jgi:hypothetical protein
MAHEKPMRPRRIENILNFWEAGGNCKSQFAEHFLQKAQGGVNI